jgi:hypothetical protein
MKWTAYNKKGRLTWFGLPFWAESLINVTVGVVVMMTAFTVTGCEDTTSAQAPAPPPSKYRVVQIYGADHYGTSSYAYHTDDVKYDGPWIKFYDKVGRQWTRLSGTILVEGGEN